MRELLEGAVNGMGRYHVFGTFDGLTTDLGAYEASTGARARGQACAKHAATYKWRKVGGQWKTPGWSFRVALERPAHVAPGVHVTDSAVLIETQESMRRAPSKASTPLADATRTAPKVVLTRDEVRAQLVEWIKILDGERDTLKNPSRASRYVNVRDVGDLVREMEDAVGQWIDALDEEEI